MAWYNELRGRALDEHNKGVEELKRRALRAMKLPSEDKLVVRPLRPQDVGLANPQWTFNVATGSAVNTLIDNTSIADNRFILINGVAYGQSGTAALSQLIFTRGGSQVAQWNIQHVNFMENPVQYSDQVVLIDQNTGFTLEGYATTTNATEALILLGTVVEREGLLLARE